jgi:hypothetical protein
MKAENELDRKSVALKSEKRMILVLDDIPPKLHKY